MARARVRIVGLGNSTTAGTPGFQSPLEYPPQGRGNPESQYAFWMMKIHPEWTVLNRGINGQRSDEILRRFVRDVTGEGPDYVIILAGVNDVYQGRPRAFMERNLRSLYTRALGGGMRVVAATILPYDTATPSASATIRALNAWVRSTAAGLGILYCDTYRAVGDPADPDRLARSPDGLHPDVAGYRRMGETLAVVVEHDLRRRPLVDRTQA